MIRGMRLHLGAAALFPTLLGLPVHAATTTKPAKPAPAATEATRALGTVDAWTAYFFKDKSGRVCYLVGAPEKTEPANAKRKPPTAMVTHRPDEKIANVISFVEGYPLKEGSDVALDIGGSKYDLFTKDDSAWSRTAETDKTIVEALAKGKTAVVKGAPRRGPETTDTYSLAGFKETLAMIDKACGVKR